jgi:competence CoiA-like predicted nuclease
LPSTAKNIYIFQYNKIKQGILNNLFRRIIGEILMQYAFIDGTRRKAFKQGRGVCPLCEKPVIAHCGEIYVSHWKHQGRCDPWSEPETEWHLGWKEEFPEEWREIVLKNNETGEKHIADIKTSEGVVIEFQNSSIQSSEICAREEFYQNMIWVVNAEKFKNNFSMTSIVKSKLRLFRESIEQQNKVIEEEAKKELEEIKKWLKSTEYDYLSLKSYNKRIQEEFAEYLEYLSQPDAILETIITKLMQLNSSTYLSYKLQGLLEESQKFFGESFLTINTSIQSLQEYFSYLQSRKQYLISLPDFDFLSNYKVIEFTQIEKTEKNNLENIKVIEINTKFTLFPVFHEITDQTLHYSSIYNSKKYECLLDIQPELEKIDNEIKRVEKEIKEQNNQYYFLCSSVRKFVEEFLENKIYDIENNFNKSTTELNKKEQELNQNRCEFEESEKEIRRKLKQDLKEIQVGINDKKYFIMQKYKGSYFYTWKHEIPTWKSAHKTVYFDFGNGELFERIKDGLFRKVLKKDFLKKYNI